MPKEPRTYSDKHLDEASRELYMSTCRELQALLDNQDEQKTARPERLEALAAVGQMAWNGVFIEDDEDDEPKGGYSDHYGG